MLLEMFPDNFWHLDSVCNAQGVGDAMKWAKLYHVHISDE